MNKSQITKFLKETELDVQSARAALFAADLVFGAYVNSYAIYKINYGPIFCYVSYNNLETAYQIIIEKNIREVAKKNYLDYLKNKKSIDRKIEKYYRLTKEVDLVWGKYKSGKGKELSNKELLPIYEKLIESSIDWWHHGMILEDKGKIIDLRIVPYFKTRFNVDENEARRIVGILSHPKEQAIFNLERKAFFGICLEVEKSKKTKTQKGKLENKINHYIKNYFWIKSNFYQATELTVDDITKDAKKELSKNNESEIKKEIKKIDDNFKNVIKDQKKLLKKLKLNRKDKKLIYFANRLVFWMDERKVGMMKQLYYTFSFLNDVAKRFSMEYHDAAICTVDEVRELISKGNKIGKKEIANRNEGAFMVLEKNKKVKMIFGEEGRKLFDIATHVDEKEIKGTVASSGSNKIVKGVARIVLNPVKSDFKKGEILVTSMTRVEFIPLMRKASAVVTNEGGLACHAAIVSRELGIPAIIGTKNATRMLKDGDLIELDLSKGVVKKIV